MHRLGVFFLLVSYFGSWSLTYMSTCTHTTHTHIYIYTYILLHAHIFVCSMMMFSNLISPRSLDMLTHTPTHTTPCTHEHSIQTRTKMQYDDVVEFYFGKRRSRWWLQHAHQMIAACSSDDCSMLINRRTIRCIVIHTQSLSLSHTHHHSSLILANYASDDTVDNDTANKYVRV